MRTFIVFLILLLSTLAESPASNVPKPDTIKISTEEFPPFTTTNLKHYGLMSHIVSQAFLLEGINTEYTFLPAARSFYVAKHAQVDATLPWAKRTGREVSFYYSDPILDVGWESFFFKKNLALNWNAKERDYNTLKGLKIGAIISYDYGDKFQQAEKDKVIIVIRVSSLIQLFELLLAERIDTFISKELVAQYILQTKFSQKMAKQLDFTRENLDPPSYDYLLISKNRDNAVYYLNAINSGLKKLRASGKFSKFINDYKNGRYLIEKN